MISEEKQRLREEVRRRIRDMGPDGHRERSQRIAEWLAKGLGASPGLVLGFAPLRSEPDWVSPQTMSWTIGLPRIEDGRMEFHRLVQWEGLVAGAMGNREPAVAVNSILGNGDVALVPGLAFDTCGGRVGRGGGYYDRFLAQFGGRKIGVCFACQLVDRVPMEPHDAAVDAIVTEDGWIEARSSVDRPD